ncbi:Histone-lysine N-methyltransferase SETMAR [Habropoda laboriosa]|uniref:Histone-lysine N-methyltransferase SETMAR n=1 Tax=Habropoda laboriosa TaxID=597456 RepID=A0A0L7R5P4_9HYME|nr:Histone-lysine N-methyltransferase SETMAR [Habropoda laboriosa]
MHKKLFVKQPSLVNRKGPILLYDNACPHVSQFTIREIHNWVYSPDLSPTDYRCFKHLNYFLREKIFRDEEDAVNTLVEFIHSRTPDFYCHGIGTLVKRWKKCTESNVSIQYSVSILNNVFLYRLIDYEKIVYHQKWLSK